MLFSRLDYEQIRTRGGRKMARQRRSHGSRGESRRGRASVRGLAEKREGCGEGTACGIHARFGKAVVESSHPRHGGMARVR